MEAAESLFRCFEQLGLVCGQTTMAHIALFAKMHWPEC